MKFVSTTLIAAALLAGGAAHAGSQTYAVGTPESGLVGTSTFEFSPLAIQVLNAAAANFYKVEPSTVTVTKRSNGRHITVQSSSPIGSITVEDGGGDSAGPGEPQILALGSQGGMLLYFEPDGFGGTGNFLFDGLRADLVAKQIHAIYASADQLGGTRREAFNLPLWNFSTQSIQLNTSLLGDPQSSAGVVARIELTDLTFTPEALALLAVGVPYDSGPIADDFSMVADVGKFTAVIHAIPEPSTFVLTGLGLALMGLASRRSRSGSGSLRP